MKAIKLTETISPAVITKSEKIFNQIKDVVVDENLEYNKYIKSLKDIKKLPKDNEKFVSELSVLTTNSSDLVIKNGEEPEEIIEDYTEEEQVFLESLRRKQQDDYEKLERLKEHENQSLYLFHRRMYVKKYGEIEV